MAELIPNDAPDEGEQPKKKKRKGYNVVLAAMEWLEENYEFKINTHTGKVLARNIGDDSRSNDFSEWNSRRQASLWKRMRTKEFIPVSDQILDKLIHCEETPLWDPIEDYLKSLPERQGFSAIRRLAGSLELAKAKEKIKLSDGRTISYELACEMLLRRWLIGCVACGLGKNPNHVCLVLVGAQRKYKTTWLNRLCPSDLPDYRFTGHIEPTISTGETPNLLAEKFWLNIDDQLEVIIRRDFNAMKSLITVDEITNRKPYAPKAERRRRIANIVASVNSTDFLTDVENRRYLCIEVEMCHVGKMPDIDQVWAEAYTAFKGGERCYFNAEEYEMLNAMTSNFVEQSLEQQWLYLCYRPASEEEIGNKSPNVIWLKNAQILKRLQEASGSKHLSDKKLSTALKLMGYIKDTKRMPTQKNPEKRVPNDVYYVVDLNYTDASAAAASWQEAPTIPW